MITRLQLGTSRLENLQPKVRQVFLDKSWMHLGDPGKENISTKRKYSFSYLYEILKSYKLSYIFMRLFRSVINSRGENTASNAKIRDIYKQTNFKEFYYHKGDKLPFDDNSINFIYSEHFFEHLFVDEALSLLKECNRILRPFGVIRTCVPDADLRTYEPAETIGFPNKKMLFTDPDKHKTRWSVYSLEQVLGYAGFEPIPLRYCDKAGQYVKLQPSSIGNMYEKCPERELLFDLSYVNRIDSLIVDGIKGPPNNCKALV